MSLNFAGVKGLERVGSEIFKAKHGDDGDLFAEFYKRKVLLSNQTDETGEIVTREVIYIRMGNPGNKLSVKDRPARLEFDGRPEPLDNERFPVQWQRFQNGEQQLAVGTPLEELGLGTAEINGYKVYNIYTIEHLLKVPDGLIPELPMGTRGVIAAGKKYLENKAEKSNSVTAMQEQILKMQAVIDDLTSKVNGEAAKKQLKTNKTEGVENGNN